jgi:PAS domain S-box-containing protein
VSRSAAALLGRLPPLRRARHKQRQVAAEVEKRLFDAQKALHRARATRAEIVAGRKAIEGYARTLEKKIAERNATLSQVQASLQRSHVELNQLFNIGVPLCLIDRGLKIQRVNESFCTYFGLRKEEVIGHACQDVVRSSMCRGPQCLLKQVMGGMNFCEFEEDILVRGRRTVSCMVTAVPFRSEDGELVGIVENFIDIARLKRAENSLRSSEERYRLLLETSNDIILATDEVGAIAYINQAGVDRSGHSLTQLIGRHVIELIPQYRFIPPPGEGEELERDPPHLQTASIISSDGGRIPVELSASVLSERGRFSGMLLYARDISERISAARRIQDSLKEKEALLKEIHHRVKNNLQIISSLLDLAGNRAANPAVATALAAARSKIFAMAIIHSQLYQSERFDHIDMDRHVQDLAVNLAAIFGGDKAVQLRCLEGGVCLSVTQAIPCALVLNELISNAYRHAFPRGGDAGTITVAMHPLPDGCLAIEVTDDGCGIPPSVDLQRTTSLGLKLVRNLVEKQLRGRLEIIQGGGTRVRIVFKVQEEGSAHDKHPDR